MHPHEADAVEPGHAHCKLHFAEVCTPLLPALVSPVSLCSIADGSVAAGRLSKKERKRTITEELLADPELSQARKRRFDKLQVVTVNLKMWCPRHLEQPTHGAVTVVSCPSCMHSCRCVQQYHKLFIVFCTGTYCFCRAEVACMLNNKLVNMQCDCRTTRHTGLERRVGKPICPEASKFPGPRSVELISTAVLACLCAVQLTVLLLN